MLPEAQERFAPKYQKIPNLFKRSPETHGIVAGEFSSPTLEYLKELPWIVQEKIDGTNVRIIWDGNRVTFGTKNTLDTANMQGRLRVFLEEAYGTPEFEQIIEQVFGETPVTIYGEGYGSKVQTGADYFPNEPEGANGFLGFDVRVDGRYVSVEDTDLILAQLGVPMVPQHALFSIPELFTQLDPMLAGDEGPTPEALLHHGTQKEIEGYVLRTLHPLRDQYGNRVMTKVILDDVRKVLAENDPEDLAGWLW